MNESLDTDGQIDQGSEAPPPIDNDAELRSRQRTALLFAIGGSVLGLAGILVDVDAVIGPLLGAHFHAVSEISAGTGIAVLGFWTAKHATETFLDTWEERRNLKTGIPE